MARKRRVDPHCMRVQVQVVPGSATPSLPPRRGLVATAGSLISRFPFAQVTIRPNTMQLLSVLATTAFAFTASAAAATIQECTNGEQRSVSKLFSFGYADQIACTKATAWQPTLSPLPTGSVLAKVCADTSCQSVISAVDQTILTDCTISGTALRSQWLDPLTASCAALRATPTPTTFPPTPPATTSPPATGPPATPSAPAPTPPLTPSPTPAPPTTPLSTTAAPTPSNSSSGSASSQESDPIIAPPRLPSLTTSPVVSSSPSAPAKSSAQAKSAISTQVIVISAGASLFVMIAAL